MAIVANIDKIDRPFVLTGVTDAFNRVILAIME